MIRRRAASIPLIPAVLAVVAAALEIVVSLQNTAATSHPLGPVDWLVAFEVALPPLAFAAVGAFVVMRRPGNRIGWLMIVIGLGFALGTFTSDYPGFRGGTHVPTRPFGTVVAWVSTWDWGLYLLALFLLLLLFPTGELPSKRWKPVLWIGSTVWIVTGGLSAVAKGPIDNQPVENPFGLLAFPQFVSGVALVCGLLAIAVALVSLALRFPGSHGELRQQLKWFTTGAALAIIFVIVAFVTGWTSVFALFALLALSGLPAFMGIAILRYRLYDIDVLIKRTLVYSILTASLALLYVSEVIVLQAFFRNVTGQQSKLAIALSTLAIAAMFQPLRHRIQSMVDRRFYRRKYDAARTIETFQNRLRDEVDLDRLTLEMVQVVDATFQPATVSLWLREGSP